MKGKGTTNGLNSLLGAGVDCEGAARVDGTLRLDGAFRGSIEVGETLVIGHEGSFTGTACGKAIIIAGRFVGEVMGTEQVELQKGAHLEGDVLTRSFVIEPGVYFQGSCRMEYTEADEARLRAAASVRPQENGRKMETPSLRSLINRTEPEFSDVVN